MIQFRRGKTDSWKKLKKPLADGQPGYDKDKHKLKIGDGETLWDQLPYASISEEEVLDSEDNAKKRRLQDPESLAIITYGDESPDKGTVGRLYLQYYDTEPEADYIIASGVDGIWSYQVWKSGTAHCWGTISLETSLQTAVGRGNLYCNDTSIKKIKYPFTFIKTDKTGPVETATLTTADNKITWLASRAGNSATESGQYTILSFDEHTAANYKIALSVSGKIDKASW
jgi:hypothetical protein